MQRNMIYLDAAATAPPNDKTIEIITKSLKEDYFNPSALYYSSTLVKEKISLARNDIASILGVLPKEVYFTSGATEANNWAIFNGFKVKKGNVVMSQGEHASVHECCLALKNKGFEVRFVPLNSDGTVNIDEFTRLVDEKTALVSMIHVSNETGAENDISFLSKLAKSKNKNLIFHSDGVQAFGKNKNHLPAEIDLYSVSGHKVGAPKGIGALYINSRINIAPFILGGGHEEGMRSGTENTIGIFAFANAAKIYANSFVSEKIRQLNDSFLSEFENGLSDYKIISANKNINIITISIDNIKSEILQRLLHDEGVIVGLGSACAAKYKGNRILSAMGLSARQIEGSIRISFMPDISEENLIFAAKKIKEKIALLREKSIG